MLSLSSELKRCRKSIHLWPKVIWTHLYRDFKLYYEQDDELHYFVVSARTQRSLARISLVLLFIVISSFIFLSVHSGLSIVRFNHLEQEKIVAEKKRKEALEALSQLSGEAQNIAENASQDELLHMAKEYKERVSRLEQMVEFSTQELARANRSLEMGLKAAGLKSSDLNRLKLSLANQILPSGGPDPTLEFDDEHAQMFNNFKTRLSENESLNKLIKAFPSRNPVRLGFSTSKYGLRIHPITKQLTFHEGDDFVPTLDTNAYITSQGTVKSVVFSQHGYGNVVTVNHSHGISTLYAHLGSINVKPNQKVKVGDVVGKIGNTGFSTGQHLHYEIIVNDTKVNPSIMTAMAKNVY